jgi:hypothetical protein
MRSGSTGNKSQVIGLYQTLEVITHHSRYLAHWEMQSQDGEVEMKRASFAEINGDGYLRHIYGFFDLASA